MGFFYLIFNVITVDTASIIPTMKKRKTIFGSAYPST